jgi:hypothetical protein
LINFLQGLIPTGILIFLSIFQQALHFLDLQMDESYEAGVSFFLLFLIAVILIQKAFYFDLKVRIFSLLNEHLLDT